MMAIKCCKLCKPPDRYPGCHSHCEKYIEEKAQYEQATAAARREKAIQSGIAKQKFDGVHRDFRRKGIK